ncbi:MAG: alpha/beta fold hydrolase [Bacteroidia bacterium]
MKLNFKKIGEGKPLLILHGLFGQLDNWMTFGKKISEQGYAAYLVDLRNHGHSPHDENFNFQFLSDDVVELINDEQLKNVNLLGHSLGGKTAMTVALNNASLVSKLIVVDIAPKYYPVHHDEIIAALHSVNLDLINSRSGAEKILSEKISDFGTKQFLLKNLFWKTDTQLAWRFNLDAIEKNIDEVGKQTVSDNKFEKPTLFIRGEKSKYILDEDLIEIKNLFPNSKLITAPNAGHWVHADAPQWFLENVSEFLTK